jgi:formylmethanofuran dehydrogenase subunit B
VIVVDVRPTATSAAADRFLQIPPRSDFEILQTMRALLAGNTPALSEVHGVPVVVLTDLVERMKRCRFGIVFFGLSLARGRVGHRTIEALLRLTSALNDFTRFYARRMRVSGDVAGADSVLAWQTGFPFSVNYARGYPRYNPGEFSAQAMLERGEIDACLLVGSHGLRRLSPAALDALRRVPTVVLDNPLAEPLVAPTVRFTTDIYGIHRPGVVYRMDEVPIPLRAVLPSEYPSDREVLDGIHDAVRRR